MREMKDSGVEWIGTVPKHWNIMSLGSISVDIRNGYVGPTRNILVESGIPYIQSLHVKDGKISFDKAEYFVTPEWGLKHPKVQEGQIVIVQTGDIGQVGLVEKSMNGYNCHALIIVTVDKERIIPNFLQYYLRSKLGKELLLQTSTGALLPHLNSGKIKSTNVICPPVEEQKRIADYLDHKCSAIDTIVAKQEQIIERLKTYKISLITEAVTKGLDPDVEMKNSGVEWIGTMPQKCVVTLCKHVYSIILGKMLTTEPKSEEDTLEKYFCAANVHFDGVDDSDLKKMWFSEYERQQYMVTKGDLLVVEGGAGAGGAAVATTDYPGCFIQNSVMIVRGTSTTYNKWLYYTLFSLVKRNYVDFVCNKATIPHFTKDKLGNVPVVLFPRGETEKIVDYLDRKCNSIDRTIRDRLVVIERLNAYKKSLIYEVVTGKKEV